MSKSLPRTLLEAARYFADLDVATAYVAKLRWANGPVCPACGGTEHSYLTTRRLWKCKNKECRKQFSVKVGTIFEDSPIPLDKWLCSIWFIANSKNGISSHELGRSVGLTQKSAWFVLHRIRLAMETGTFELLDGEVEVDETFVGGLAENMHEHKRANKRAGRGNQDKAIVAGARERGGEVRASVMVDRKRHSLLPFIQMHVEPGAQVYTDKNNAYDSLRWEGFKHRSIDHSKKVYAEGRVSTNGIENFWTLLKRGLHGTYVQVAPEHLHRYVTERVFTYNQRTDTDLGRFDRVLRHVTGRRLTYAELTRRA